MRQKEQEKGEVIVQIMFFGFRKRRKELYHLCNY